jgi:hypothetical protein
MVSSPVSFVLTDCRSIYVKGSGSRQYIPPYVNPGMMVKAVIAVKALGGMQSRIQRVDPELLFLSSDIKYRE